MSQRMAVSGQRKRDREWREVRPISVFTKANVPHRNGELRLSNQFSNPVAVGFIQILKFNIYGLRGLTQSDFRHY